MACPDKCPEMRTILIQWPVKALGKRLADRSHESFCMHNRFDVMPGYH